MPTPRHLPILERTDQIALHAWVQLIRTHNLVIRGVTSLLLPREMTVPQFDVLATLKFSEGVTQTELAERLLVTKGNVCQVLDRMEKLGWVQRRVDPKDARVNRLFLTTVGRKKIDALLPRHDALIVRSMKNLSANETALLRTLLEKMESGVTADCVQARPAT